MEAVDGLNATTLNDRLGVLLRCHIDDGSDLTARSGQNGDSHDREHEKSEHSKPATHVKRPGFDAYSDPGALQGVSQTSANHPFVRPERSSRPQS